MDKVPHQRNCDVYHYLNKQNRSAHEHPVSQIIRDRNRRAQAKGKLEDRILFKNAVLYEVKIANSGCPSHVPLLFPSWSS